MLFPPQSEFAGLRALIHSRKNLWYCVVCDLWDYHKFWFFFERDQTIGYELNYQETSFTAT